MSSGLNKPFETLKKTYDGPAPGPASESGAQIWACCRCKRERKWGEGQPADKIGTALLLCEGTCEPAKKGHGPEHVEHTFVRVKVGW